MSAPLPSEPTILVVDDEKNIVELAKLYLTSEGYRVESAFDGFQAIEKSRELRPCLIVLDLMLPNVDGWEVCRLIRQESDVPIIIVSARGDDVDRIVGLELGADDYLVKPFNPRELVVRVKAVLRRTQAGAKQATAVSIGKLHVNLSSREVTVDGAPVKLRPKEFDIIATLAASPDTVFTREKLLEQVWGYNFPGDTRTVDVHVGWLRGKLAGADVEIRTVWGVGYKLVCPGE
ncbi:MAG: response regulator transcription factor [Chloroflexi bacterium]|nr:response regulator transcription factor [Chloroflexota bacterium]